MPAVIIFQVKTLLLYFLLVIHSPSSGLNPCISNNYLLIANVLTVAITKQEELRDCPVYFYMKWQMLRLSAIRVYTVRESQGEKGTIVFIKLRI